MLLVKVRLQEGSVIWSWHGEELGGTENSTSWRVWVGLLALMLSCVIIKFEVPEKTVRESGTSGQVLSKAWREVGVIVVQERGRVTGVGMAATRCRKRMAAARRFMLYVGFDLNGMESSNGLKLIDTEVLCC